jgi:short-subunit dehydrogenase
MKITITGTASGIGFELVNRLQHHDVTALTREQLDLSNIDAVVDYDLGPCDLLINCAATDVGGKIDFVNHEIHHVIDIKNYSKVQENQFPGGKARKGKALPLFSSFLRHQPVSAYAKQNHRIGHAVAGVRAV